MDYLLNHPPEYNKAGPEAGFASQTGYRLIN